MNFRVWGPLLCTFAAGNVAAQQLPDVAGIRLGMPAREAYAALQAKHPNVKLATDPLQLPTIDKPILNGFSIGFSPVQSPDERINVNVTPPPEKQVVWRVQRFIGRQKIYRANVIASLREKYGKESAELLGGMPASDKDATEMWWIFDEQGQPGKWPTSSGFYTSAIACQRTIDNLSTDAFTSFRAEGSWFAPNNIVPMEDRIQDSGWCNTSMIAVVAYIGSNEIVAALGVEAINIPLALRSARAEIAWLKDLANRQQQQQVNESKQAKPKL